MKNSAFILLLYLTMHLSVQAQSSVHNQSSSIFPLPSFQGDYNKLLPDTVVLWFQIGRIADSVRRVISSSKEDTNKVWKYFLLAQGNIFANPDSAIFFAQQGLLLAKKINFEPGEYYCTLSLGLGNFAKGNLTGALPIFFNLRRRVKSINEEYRQAWELHNIGATYLYAGELTTALHYIRQAVIEIEPHIQTFPSTARVFLSNLGQAYFDLNQLDSALLVFKKAYEIDTLIHGFYDEPPKLMAAIYARKGQYDTALIFYRKAFYLSKYISPFPLDTIDNLNGIASVFEKTGQYDSSLYYARSALASAKSFPLPRLQSCAILTDVYKGENRMDSAFKYQQIQIKIRDEIAGQEKLEQLQNITFNEQLQQQEIAAAQAQYRNKEKIYMLLATVGVFLLIAFTLWRNNQHKQRAYVLLQQQKAKTDQALLELKATQTQLIQSEKMASLGQLTAGIAHEIQNPLNFVNNFSEINTELIAELKGEIEKGDLEEVKVLANDIEENELKIIHHGKRADSIVKGMLEHSRASTGKREPTDLNALVDECLRLSYHGMKAKDKEFNAKIDANYDENISKINAVPQDISRVLINLLNNAFYAVVEKKRQLNGMYEPAVSVCTKKLDGKVEIHVSDNGNGIPQNIIDKIFQPFFTTKPTGQGTGLGLSLSYDIIKALGGEIKVESKKEEGCAFIIELPYRTTDN